MVTGPAHPGPFVALHVISFLVWMPTIAIHVLAHIGQVPRLVAKGRTPGGVTFGALAAGTVAAFLLSPVAAPWTSRMDHGNPPGTAFIVVGLVLAALGLLAGLPLKLKR